MLPPQDGRLMSQGNEVKFQRGTAAKRNSKIETRAQRIVITVRVRPACENLQPYPGLVEF